jgi:caspase domain-containing protein
MAGSRRCADAGPLAGHAAETRFALVIGNDEYKLAKLNTAANDAGLVAQALTAAGFTVTGARNLDQATLRESFREFLGQVAAAGSDAIAVVYLAGFGVQFAGDNYFVPVDADPARDVDVPLQAVRMSDFAQPLAALRRHPRRPGRRRSNLCRAATCFGSGSGNGQGRRPASGAAATCRGTSGGHARDPAFAAPFCGAGGSQAGGTTACAGAAAAPAAVKPPSAPPPAAHPACPPGKTLAEVNGHPTCK